MGVSLNGGTPKSSILNGFSIINHPFWGTTILGNPHMLSFWEAHGSKLSFRVDIFSVGFSVSYLSMKPQKLHFNPFGDLQTQGIHFIKLYSNVYLGVAPSQ